MGSRCKNILHLLALFVLSSVLLFQRTLAADHPQSKIFPSQFTFISVGVNPKATVRLINPAFSGEYFGQVKIPSPTQFITGSFRQKDLLEVFGVGRKFTIKQREEFVPPETGRGLLLPPTNHSTFRDVLIKGTGPVEQFTQNNQLRFAHLGFDGYFEISEAVRDMTTSEALHAAGVLVSRGIAIIDHNEQVHRNGLDHPVRVGNYIRAFRVQTRLSNLVSLSPDERQNAIDDAILRLQTLQGRSRPMTYVEYYHYMVQKLALNAAIYQAIGYTQNSLHFGQVTLAGEMADLGVGTFERPKQPGEVNTSHPWFRFERQPLLLQNMLYRTHSVKAEPHPVLLSPDSKTVINQQTLFSFIQSFDPDSARRIEEMNPMRMFWEAYDQQYRRFDYEKYRKKVLPKLQDLYSWSLEKSLKRLPKHLREAIRKTYLKLLRGYEKGVARPTKSGPLQVTALEKERLFSNALTRNNLNAVAFLPPNGSHSWDLLGSEKSFLEYHGARNLPDISWRPQNLESFFLEQVGMHPLEMLLLPGTGRLEVGQKIIWMTEAGVSPIAVITKQLTDRFAISYEHPLTGEILNEVVSTEELLKLNDPRNAKISEGDLISGTKLTMGNTLKARARSLQERVNPYLILPHDSDSAVREKQLRALKEVVAEAYTTYVSNLNPEEQKTYSERLYRRLNQKDKLTLQWSMVKGCGNCMDQNLFTSVLLSQISRAFQFTYSAYIAKDPNNKTHFYTIVTLLPSQQQYVLESSFFGIRLFPLRQALVFPRFLMTNIVDQHKPSKRGPKALCARAVAN